MKWSKQKKLLESLLADSLKGHLEFYVTRYRSGGGISNYLERAWITWQGKELVNFATSSWWNEYAELTIQIERANNVTKPGIYKHPRWWSECSKFSREHAEDLLYKKSSFTCYDFLHASAQYLDLSIDDALQSDDPIIRALAMLDRRVGKRRLAKMELIEAEHPLVRQFYNLRSEAEGLLPTSG
jgi:hypothetical protein